jgi:alpha-D-xyloside xylohydrolase
LVLRKFTALKHSLIPYLYSNCQIAAEKGYPLMRPMLMEFPEDPTCWFLDKQFMLGESLLVAPVFNSSGLARYYLPDGEWTNWWTGEKVPGGKWFQHKIDYLTVPLYVRENSLIPTGPVESAPIRSSFDGLTINLFNIKTGSEYDLYDEDQTLHIKVEKNENRLQLALSKTIPGLKVNFKGIGNPVKIEGGKSHEVSGGDLIIEPDDKSLAVII